MPWTSVCCSCRRNPSWRTASACSSSRKIIRSGVGEEYTSSTSGTVPRRSSVRSMEITGVIPLPPTRNSIRAGGGLGSTKSPAGAASRTIVPGARPRTRWSERNPSGIARTVIVIVLRSCSGGELREYERQWKRPSTCTPMPTY